MKGVDLFGNRRQNLRNKRVLGRHFGSPFGQSPCPLSGRPGFVKQEGEVGERRHEVWGYFERALIERNGTFALLFLDRLRQPKKNRRILWVLF